MKTIRIFREEYEYFSRCCPSWLTSIQILEYFVFDQLHIDLSQHKYQWWIRDYDNSLIVGVQ